MKITGEDRIEFLRDHDFIVQKSENGVYRVIFTFNKTIISEGKTEKISINKAIRDLQWK